MTWALLATALFTLVAVMAKVAVTDYHVLQILFFRQIVVLLSTLPSVWRLSSSTLCTRRPALHALRLGGAFVALSCGIWAVAILPLTTAITLAFVKVLFVTLLAACFLKESIGRHRSVAVMAGFAGVLIILRPGLDGLNLQAALVPLLGALGAAVAVLSVRALSSTESTATLLFYQASFVGLLAGLPLLHYWNTPDLNGVCLLLGMGILATLGQWLGVKALRLGEASVVGPVEYISLIYAALFGFWLFSEVPDRYTLLGAAIIIGSSIHVARREAFRRRASTTRRASLVKHCQQQCGSNRGLRVPLTITRLIRHWIA